MGPDFLNGAREIVQNNLVCIGLVGVSLLALAPGWVTPFFSENKRFELIDRYRKLTQSIQNAKYLHKKLDRTEVQERRMLMILRGAKFHSAIQKILRY